MSGDSCANCGAVVSSLGAACPKCGLDPRTQEHREKATEDFLARDWDVAFKTRPVLLGETPAPGGDPTRPLSGRTARTLCDLAQVNGLDGYQSLRRRFECANVIRRRADAFPWSTSRAHAGYAEIVLRDFRPMTIVCLGRKVAAAARLPHDLPWGTWVEGEVTRVVIPHPSGLNRLYNDVENRELAGRVLREALERAT